MFGAALTQVIIGVGQGIAMLLFGVLVVGLTINWLGILLVLGVMVLAAAAFIALGSLIAALNRKTDIAGYVFFFSMMPLVFLASFPPEMMPDLLNAIATWLPTSMAIELIGALFFTGHLPTDALFQILGLLVYTTIFATFSARQFKWEM
jgi:ABC-type multidrug transport system permease subunit